MSAELTAPIMEKSKEKRIVTGPVLIPGEPDSDGDVLSEERIEELRTSSWRGTETSMCSTP